MNTLRELKMSLYNDSLVGSEEEKEIKKKELQDFIEEVQKESLSKNKGPQKAKEDIEKKYKDRIDEIKENKGKIDER